MPELGRVQYFEVRSRKVLYSLIIGLALFLIIFFMPTPDGLTILGQRTLAIFILIIVLWITEALPLPVTAFIPGILLFFLRVRETPSEAFMTYAHPAVFFIIGSLLIAQGLLHSGIAKRFALGFMSKCRNNPSLLLFMLIVASASLAAFISDHLVVAMFIPVVMAIVVSAKITGKFRISLVLAIAFGAGIAGLATPSGGARNIVVLGMLQEMASMQIPYIEWMIAAAPITLILIPVVWITLRLVYPPDKDINIQQAVEQMKGDMEPMSSREWKALGIFILIIVLFITTSDLIGLGTIAILGAVLMFLTGVVDWSEVEKGVPWGIMFIYGAALTMGIALRDTGAATWLANGFLQFIPHTSPLILIIGVVLLTALLTQIMSDGATASVLAPITISMALVGSIDPRLMAMATAIPAAFAFATIFGTPPNAIAYSSGYFNSKELFKGGIIVAIVAVIVMLVVVQYYWTWLGLL